MSATTARTRGPDLGSPGPRPGRSRRAWAPWLVVLALAAAWALVSAWWMPRGPVSTAQSLTCVGLGLALGVTAGWLTGSRWAMLLAPLAFAVFYEVARVPVDGPTVDGFHASFYGAVALVTGRLFHALVALLPMAWGAAAGAAVRRRADGRPAGTRLARWSGRAALAVTGVALLALTVGLARPASTAPIVGEDGEPLPGSVAELTTVDVNGHDLGLMIRGHDRDNPVLLFLAGGPGGTELGAMRRHLPALERDFTVATWDQRGTGRSYGELDPRKTLTVDGTVEDALEVTDYLRDRFDQDRIYVVGQSWGTILGVLAIQAAPEKYAGYVGAGQMVSPLATDRIFYDDTIEWAEDTGRNELADDLRRLGPPPYDDPVSYGLVLGHEMDMYPYDHSRNSEGRGQMSENLIVEEYSLTEQVRILGATLDTYVTLYPQIQDIDFRESATDLDVPVFFVQGAHEAPGRADPFRGWYPDVVAPTKRRVVFETSGHRPLFEQPGEFVDYLTEVVLPATGGTG